MNITQRERQFLSLMAGIDRRRLAGKLSKKDYKFIHAGLVGDRLEWDRKLLIYLEGWVKYAKRP